MSFVARPADADGPFTERSESYLAAVAERLAQLAPGEIGARIETLVERQDAWRGRCLNLNPAETLMSRRCRDLLASDMASRITEGVPGDKLYPHGELNRHFDEIEAIAIGLLRRQFGARFVEWRPVSATMANAAVFYALLEPGDVVLSQDDDAGGNYSYQQTGTAGLLGMRVSPIPSRGETFEIDVERLAEEARRLRPKMIVVGGSNILFPYPLARVRQIADEVRAIVLYDAAHVGLLVSAGDFQRPLAEGAHVVTLTTAKIMGGPIGGLVLTDDPRIAGRVSRVTFPSLLQKRDMNKASAMAFMLAENDAFGAARARQSVANARALAGALEALGFRALGADRGFTSTHQVFLDLGEDARAIEARCNAADIMLSDCALTGDMARGRRSGARLGVHEVTRLGMSEAEMAEIARLIARAVHGDPAAPLRADVQALLNRFPRVAYSFDAETEVP